MRLILALFLLLLSVPTMAQDKPDLSSFSAWPVLHDGRVKTMESFSRAVFYQITGGTSLNGLDATTWMANSLFDPVSTISTPLIKISKSDLLDLPDHSSNYYSMNDVMTALTPHQELILALEQRQPGMLSTSQKNLLNIYYAVTSYNQIIQSFSAVLPLKGKDNQSFLEGGGISAQRRLIAEGGMGNNLLKIIPHDNPSMPMISLWQALELGSESPVIDNIAEMARAWNAEDYATWEFLSDTVKTRLQSHNQVSWTLTLEHYYVMINPMIWAMVLYGLGSLMLAFPATKKMAMWPILGGFVFHIFGLLARSFILQRPPTGTLYETFLFGTAIIMIVALITLWRNKKHSGFVMLCALSSAFLLLISRGFVQGDSLNVLVAVLTTNFWLSTHVTCIIIGYAFCIMAAMIAHGVLATRHIMLEKLMMPMTLGALFFTSVGTLLGGIWADQSWGRFWGWDPKENGALVIVLWLIWILHGRLSGHFKLHGFATALALTNIMVALTWFGVNLLGVGLHSYGFISGIAWGLGSFIIIQIIVVGFLYYRYPRVVHD